MKNLVLYHTNRVILSALIILSLGQPFAASAFNNSGYLCNPSGQTPTAEADAKLKEFLIAVGEIEPNGTDLEADHCFECLTTPIAINETNTLRPSLRFILKNDDRSPRDIGLIYSQRGPPIGGRAPPHFQ